MNKNISKLFSQDYIPKFNEFFDEKDNLLVNIKFEKVNYELQNGEKYDIFIEDPKTKIKKKWLYGKLENVRNINEISKKYIKKDDTKKNDRYDCVYNFELSNNHKIFKLLKLIKEAAMKFVLKNEIKNKKKNMFITIKKKKLNKLGCKYKIIENKNIDTIHDIETYNKIIDKLSFAELCEFVVNSFPMSEDFLSYCYGKNPNNIGDDKKKIIFRKIKIPLIRFNPKWENTKKVDPNDPLIKIAKRNTNKGVVFCNFDLKKKWKIAERKYQFAKKNNTPSEDLEELKLKNEKAYKDFNDSQKITWKWSNISKYIKMGTLHKYFGIQFCTLFYSKNMCIIQTEGKHIWYTNDVENALSSPDNDEDFNEEVEKDNDFIE
jgi:hypothetical protein